LLRWVRLQAEWIREKNAELYEMQRVLLTKPRSERAVLKSEIEKLDSAIRTKEREAHGKHISGTQVTAYLRRGRNGALTG
jgi:hypothetical protein